MSWKLLEIIHFYFSYVPYPEKRKKKFFTKENTNLMIMWKVSRYKWICLWTILEAVIFTWLRSWIFKKIVKYLTVILTTWSDKKEGFCVSNLMPLISSLNLHRHSYICNIVEEIRSNLEISNIYSSISILYIGIYGKKTNR